MISDYWLKEFPGAIHIRAVDVAGCYEGNGAAIAIFKNGTFQTATYGHCSCNGPEDTMTHGDTFTTMKAAREDLGQVDLEDFDRDGEDWPE